MEENYQTECIGCKEEQPNQLAHIDCPSGCLHDETTCTICCFSATDSYHSEDDE